MAKTEAAGNAAYRECKRCFARQIVALIEGLDNVRSEMQSSLEENKSAYRKIGKGSARLYGNNFFNFLLFTGCLLFPFAVISVLIRLTGAGTFVSLLPMIAGFILTIVVTAVKLAKWAKFRKERDALRATCASSESELAILNKRFKVMAIKKKKMKRIYRALKKDPNMSEERLQKLKAQFDKIAK